MFSPKFQAGETKVVGQAFTVKFVSVDDVDAPKLSGNYVCTHLHDDSKWTVRSRIIHGRLIWSLAMEFCSSLSQHRISMPSMEV
jgi:hypothetical protein